MGEMGKRERRGIPPSIVLDEKEEHLPFVVDGRARGEEEGATRMGQTTYDDRRRSTVPRTEKDAKFPHVPYPKTFHLFKQVQVPLF